MLNEIVGIYSQEEFFKYQKNPLGASILALLLGTLLIHKMYLEQWGRLAIAIICAIFSHGLILFLYFIIGLYEAKKYYDIHVYNIIYHKYIETSSSDDGPKYKTYNTAVTQSTNNAQPNPVKVEEPSTKYSTEPFNKKQNTKAAKITNSAKTKINEERKINQDIAAKYQNSDLESDDASSVNQLVNTVRHLRNSKKSRTDNNYLPPLKNYTYPDDNLQQLNQLRPIIKALEDKSLQVTDKSQQYDAQLTIDYTNELNAAQYYAVTKIQGPMLLIAGAGTGKTRTIVYRVSYLLENDVKPEKILLLTFTRRAAEEMIGRVKKITQSQSVNNVQAGTFHSFALQMLRRHYEIINLSPNFTILDTGDSTDAISLVKDELGIKKEKGVVFPRKDTIQDIISKSRNKHLSIAQVLTEEFPKYREHAEVIEQIRNAYSQYKQATNSYDFDDLLEVFRNKLQSVKQFRDRMHHNIHYILVDEYQDTNITQKQILDLLTNQDRNIVVVGDDAQSIYAFRGANFENILRFPLDYRECRIVKIEENYRSTQKILGFTNAMINNAIMGYQKLLTSSNQLGSTPQFLKFPNREEEACFIANKIEELYSQGRQFNTIAVLNRSSWHNIGIQIEFDKRRIPYKVVGGFKFIERQHVKDTLTYLKLSCNITDGIAWHRLLKKIDGIGNVRASRIIRAVVEQGFDFIENYKKTKYYSPLKSLLITIGKVIETVDLPDKIDVIFEHYYPILEVEQDDSETRKLDLLTLKEISAKYADAESFINDFALEPPNSQYFQDGEKPSQQDKDSVTISTIHSAKGLEWSAVFIPHAIDGALPSYKSLGELEKLEEERRLFYVAVTRAKHQLWISMPSYITDRYGTFSLPSRFIVEAYTKCKNSFEFVIK